MLKRKIIRVELFPCLQFTTAEHLTVSRYLYYIQTVVHGFACFFLFFLLLFFFSFLPLPSPPPATSVEAGSLSVALAGLELAMYVRMASNSQSELRFIEVEELSNLL